MNSFEYEPINLEGHSFRLLLLCKGDFGNVRCELIHAHLDDESLIEYEALSYTWGGAFKAHDIEVGGSIMAVTKNLSLALQSLRKPHEDRVLWIDAICIDQENDKERGHQVLQMASIYAKAEKVLVWLGPSTLATDLVFDGMSRFEKKAAEYACRDWNVSDRRWREIWSSVQSEDRDDEDRDEKTILTSDQYIGLEDLSSRPWFDRVWIIQEVANARAARVMCGTKSVLARTFALYVFLSQITLDQQCQAVLDVMPGPTRKHSWWIRNHDLSTLLLKFRGSQASDPRDKIYALLGISSDRFSADFPVPNYEKSEIEVVQNAIGFLLQLHAGTEEHVRLPSWTIPDLMQRLEYLAHEMCIDAAGDGDFAMVKLLLDTGKADPKFRNEDGQTSLLRAAEEGHASIVRLLLDTGLVDIDYKHKHGQTPLLVAAENGHEAVVRLLVGTHKANANSRNNDGQTPLLLAAKNGHQTVVKCLLDTGASDLSLKDLSGWSPVWTAAINGHKVVAEMLLHANDAKALYSSHSAAFDTDKKLMIELLGTHKLESEYGEAQKPQAPLVWAAERRYMTLFALFLEAAPVDISKVFFEGELTIKWAVRSGRDDVVKLLLDTIKTDLTLEDDWARALLRWGVKDGDYALFNHLFATGRAGVFFSNESCRQLFSDAADAGNLAVVRFFLDIGISHAEGRGRALWQAGEQGLLQLVERLVETTKVDVNFKEKDGQTPLWRSAWNGKNFVANILLGTPGIEIDAKDDKFGQTPLMIATRFGHADIVRPLLKTKSADIRTRDRSGRTLLDYARKRGQEESRAEGWNRYDYEIRKGYDEIIKLLERYGAP